MDKDTLHKIELKIIGEQAAFTYYAGNAFLTDDEEMKNLFKGQYIALERLRKYVSEEHLKLLVAEDEEKDKEEEQKTYSEYVKKQMATLLPYDQHLFDDIAKGLVKEGWVQKGGSETFRLLDKGNAAIKMFRHAESPQVINICFSAEPEEEELKELSINTSEREDEETKNPS